MKTKAKNKGLMFHRMMLRTEENFYEGRYSLLDFGTVYHSGIEIRGSKQKSSSTGRIAWSTLLNFPSFFPKKYHYQRKVS